MKPPHDPAYGPARQARWMLTGCIVLWIGLILADMLIQEKRWRVAIDRSGIDLILCAASLLGFAAGGKWMKNSDLFLCCVCGALIHFGTNGTY